MRSKAGSHGISLRHSAGSVWLTEYGLPVKDQTKRLREPFVERTPAWRLPAVNEIRHPVGHVDQIDVALTDHLVRDRDATVMGVPDPIIHGVIFLHQG